MPPAASTLRLTLAFPEPGHKFPVIVLADGAGAEIGRVPTAEPQPALPCADASVRAADARDVLEHVHDEQAWLAELNRVLVPGGELTVRVPLDNLLAWADALNITRYIGDVLGFGDPPTETLPTGWHRHYAPGDLPAILELAGFEVVASTAQGLPLEEAPHLLGLVGSMLLPRPRSVQRRLFTALAPLRDRPRLPLPRAIASTITVRARKVREGYRPAPDLDPEHRPELEVEDSLE